jgi:hypothetical protein
MIPLSFSAQLCIIGFETHRACKEFPTYLETFLQRIFAVRCSPVMILHCCDVKTIFICEREVLNRQKLGEVPKLKREYLPVTIQKQILFAYGYNSHQSSHSSQFTMLQLLTVCHINATKLLLLPDSVLPDLDHMLDSLKVG